MTRDELRTKMQTAVERYARNIADNGVPFSLVEELADIAGAHAVDESKKVVDRMIARRKNAEK